MRSMHMPPEKNSFMVTNTLRLVCASALLLPALGIAGGTDLTTETFALSIPAGYRLKTNGIDMIQLSGPLAFIVIEYCSANPDSEAHCGRPCDETMLRRYLRMLYERNEIGGGETRKDDQGSVIYTPQIKRDAGSAQMKVTLMCHNDAMAYAYLIGSADHSAATSEFDALINSIRWH